MLAATLKDSRTKEKNKKGTGKKWILNLCQSIISTEAAGMLICSSQDWRDVFWEVVKPSNCAGALHFHWGPTPQLLMGTVGIISQAGCRSSYCHWGLETMPLSASGERSLSDGRHNHFSCNLENILVKAALNIQDPAPLDCSSLCLLLTFNSYEPNSTCKLNRSFYFFSIYLKVSCCRWP